MARYRFASCLWLSLFLVPSFAAHGVLAQAGGTGCDKMFGTTIISHGRNKSVKSQWVQEMAEAIIGRAQMEGGSGGTILRYDPDTGWAKYVQGSLVPDGEVVLIFNWVADSGIFVTGNTGSGEAAADACFTALADAHVVAGDGVTPLAGWESFNFLDDQRHLHFIGHSRGAVISSATVQRIGGVLNREVEHVTSLDPFPWNPANDPFPTTWSHVVWADNYFQDLALPLFNPASFPLDGAWDFELSGILGGNGCESFPHNDVPLWYLGTIDLAFAPCPPDVNRDDWYPAGDEHGYWYSDLVCDHVSERPATTGSATDPPATPAIINGDFELGPWAGWRYHGGYLDEEIMTGEVSPVFFDALKGSQVLVLGGLYDGWAQHNRFFLTQNYQFCRFAYRVIDADENQLDELLVALVDFATGDSIPLGTVDLGETTQWESAEFLISPNVERNRTYLLRLDGASPDSQIAVDDVELDETCGSCLIGDVNQDGLVNLLDVDPFVQLLSTGGYQAEADINQDGVVNLLDVDGFIALLAGG